MRVGMIAELYPQLRYTEISRVLLQAERSEDGLEQLVSTLDELFGMDGTGKKIA